MKKIAILGTTPSRMEAPLDDPEWEIWTIGPGGKDAHRWDRLFEIHTTWPENFSEYLNDLSIVKKPQKVYTVVPMKDRIQTWAWGHGKDEAWLKETITGKWASNVVIDREPLFKKYRRMWFSSSISYCIALAIEEGATDIGCWGIDLESGEEYISQHAGCAYFLDLARLSGINVHMPNGCGLMRDLNPYPDRYETNLALTFEKKKGWLEELLGRARPENEHLKLELYRTEGVVMTLRGAGAPPEKIAEAEQRLIELNQHLVNSNANVNHLEGEKSATEYYQRMYVWGMVIRMNNLEEMIARLDGMTPDAIKKLEDELVKDKEVGGKWAPSPGPQSAAYDSLADVLLYGGQAGGGKSGFLVGWALTKGDRSLLMRRQYTNLNALIDDCLEKHGTRRGFSGQPPARLNTEDKRMIEFGAAKLPGDEEQWQGQAHDFLGIDEASQFLESQVRFLMGWVRPFGGKQQHCRVVLATNPPHRPGEGQWLIQMFAPWLDPSFPEPAKPGELRWVVSDENGDDKWVDGPEKLVIGKKTVKPKSRTFIPAKLSDNPFLGEEYEATLDGMQEPLRSAIRDGNWMIAHEDNPQQVIPTNWILAAQQRWTREPPKAAPMCAIGVDVAAGGVDNTVLAPRYDTWFAEPVLVPGRDTPLPSDTAALVFTHRKHSAEIVVDMGGGYGGGVFEILQNNDIPVHAFDGSNTSTKRTKDRKKGFYNRRAEIWWKFREALDPDQEGGSPIALPYDPQLVADLASPMFDDENPRGIKIEGKKEIKKRLGRSPDIGDAVVMAWSQGSTFMTHGQFWRDLTKGGIRPKVIQAYGNRKRRR